MSSTTKPPENSGHIEHGPFSWTEDAQPHAAQWHSEGGWPAPAQLVVGDDTMTADAAYRLFRAGTSVLWRGDFHNGRQLLSALGRRIDRHATDGGKSRKRGIGGGKRESLLAGGRVGGSGSDLTAAFRRHRSDAFTRAQLLGMLVVPLDADYVVPLRRAPEMKVACTEAYGPASEASVVSLRELVGVIGAHQWRATGVPVAELNERIHPHYGVFSPVRGEYLRLVLDAPLPSDSEAADAVRRDIAPSDTVAFDIGTGTGVLAAILAQRGISQVIATDLDPRALVCASENIRRLGLAAAVDIVEANLFPPGRANIVVCNPPWIPAEARASTDYAVYDPDSRMLHGFLDGLADHLEPGGEGWLIISDIAERLGLRSRGELLDWIEDAGLVVIARLDTRPTHGRASDRNDPLHAARSAEITSLWRLRAA
jgi:SAM-dependent methyltransferase